MMIIKDIMGDTLTDIVRNACIHMGYPKGTNMTVDLSRMQISPYLAGTLYKEDRKFILSKGLVELGNENGFRRAIEIKPGFLVQLNVGVALHETNGVVDEEFATTSHDDLTRHFEKNSGCSMADYKAGNYELNHRDDGYRLYSIPAKMNHTSHAQSDLMEIKI